SDQISARSRSCSAAGNPSWTAERKVVLECYVRFRSSGRKHSGWNIDFSLLVCAPSRVILCCFGRQQRKSPLGTQTKGLCSDSSTRRQNDEKSNHCWCGGRDFIHCD